MNKLEFNLRTVISPDIVILHGISFSNIKFIEMIIDGTNLFQTDFFENSFIVLDNLLKSVVGSGRYLIFTSVSGVADEGGWNYVTVEHSEKSVKWNIERDSLVKEFSFAPEQYMSEIVEISKKAKQKPELILEPEYVIYPE